MSVKTQQQNLDHVEPCTCENCKTSELEILEVQITVMKERVAEQAGTYDRLNGKLFALLGLIFTLAGLFSYDIFTIDAATIAHGANKVFFIIAAGALGVAAGLVIHGYRAKKNWSVPMGPVEVIKMNTAASKHESLQILFDDYVLCQRQRDKVIDERARLLNFALYLFSASVILLVILKLGG